MLTIAYYINYINKKFGIFFLKKSNLKIRKDYIIYDHIIFSPACDNGVDQHARHMPKHNTSPDVSHLPANWPVTWIKTV